MTENQEVPRRKRRSGEEIDPLFDKLKGSLSIDQDRLKFAEYKIRVLEERLRLVRIETGDPSLG
jgi:hypothetical protein